MNYLIYLLYLKGHISLKSFSLKHLIKKIVNGHLKFCRIVRRDSRSFFFVSNPRAVPFENVVESGQLAVEAFAFGRQRRSPEELDLKLIVRVSVIIKFYIICLSF
jgi:hypothetical protein